MDFYAARLDAAGQRRTPGAVNSTVRAWHPQRGGGNRRGLPPHPPIPPLHAAHGRGAGGSGVGKAEGGVAVGAGAAGGNAAGGLIGDGAERFAALVVATAREDRGGSGEVGTKRWLAAPRAYPPPKRRAVSARRLFLPSCGREAAATTLGDGSRFRVARADGGSGSLEKLAAPTPVAGSKDGVLLGAKSSEAVGCNAGAAADSLFHTGSQGVAGVLVEDRGKGAGSGELGRKELVPAARLRAKPRMVSANRCFPPGCGRVAASLLAGGGSSEERLWLESGHPDGGLVVLEEVVATDGSSYADDIVVAQCDGAIVGAVQDEELEEGEIAPEVHPAVEEYRESQISTNVVLHESAACRYGASVRAINDLDASARQCGEKRPSWMVAKDVKVMNKSSGSSCNFVAESLAEGPAKEHLRGKRVSESARMDGASSDVAAGLSGEGTMMRSKAMFTPRKVVKPTKVIQKSALDTWRRPFSKDKEKETEHGTRVTANEIEDTDEFSKDLAVQALMSADKCPMTQGKEVGTIRGSFGPRKKVKVKAPAHLQMKIASALGSKEKLDHKVSSNLEDDDILKALAVHEGKLELYLNSSSGLTSMRCQRQYGVQNADARSKFKMMCRRFEFICRALVQAVEQHSLKIKRIDLEADRAIRKLPGFTKPGPIVGKVPGVEVGDEFLYRVQLAIVGLHRVYQGGIDTTKDRNGMLISISIVCSGGYPDELSCSGELIYTGSGGKPAGKKDDEDQKLERGNLALKNCIKTKTPVRVIHGFKGQNRDGGSHSRAKQISTFTYDGLYHVVDCWIEGQPGSKLFKYRLQRIPGQPELPLHIAKGMRKSKMRPGLCIADISQGKEGAPICVINTVDDVRPAPFIYITRTKSSFWPTRIRPQGCDCANGCSDSACCACVVKNGGEIPFNFNGAIVNEKPLIFECGPSCKCPPSCHNRVSQHGMKIPLEVFRTTKTGWGVRSLRSISSGSFICEYLGELLHGKEADQRRNSDYLFDIGHNYDDKNLCKGLLPTVSGLNSSGHSSQTMDDVGFTIDATEYGNVGRFINHSCSPNLYAQNVLWDHDDKSMPHIMFFAAETIPPLQELTYDYNYKIDHVHDANGRIKFKCCHCGSPQCCGRLY
ncbi:histone-lysine N-methyltransferase, H3 lysine-9 specific SUVH6-like [Phragmites australis]|uniref:histone-lysine N-methyltransferase, H3 lysine-9 specific SUVH6-like n=1 Tax=Phragmites australis TaxID=29695 RepID=UPI002D7738B6|nr:histone-lysine N-methyltransferase, H3 lysine-9 specific SUVH6-like [Phragmites australis]